MTAAFDGVRSFATLFVPGIRGQDAIEGWRTKDTPMRFSLIGFRKKLGKYSAADCPATGERSRESPSPFVKKSPSAAKSALFEPVCVVITPRKGAYGEIHVLARFGAQFRSLMHYDQGPVSSQIVVSPQPRVPAVNGVL